MPKLILATRKSPLALTQAELVAARLREVFGVETELLKIVTTGDQQAGWSLEKKGGKGLFTSELEQALLQGKADVAVHSTKDLPGDSPAGLAIAGYLPREDARDTLVLRAGVKIPGKLATGSPRRRLQVARMFPQVEFTEIRGNVDTRLRKIAEQYVADGTVVAAAGLKRLGIANWPGLEFAALPFDWMVPAVGQGAIAVQCREPDAPRLAAAFDASTARGLALERALQAALGGGCHTAFGAHAVGDILYFFHERSGLRSVALDSADYGMPEAGAARILHLLNLP